MAGHVFEKFPKQIKAIQGLMQADANFAEACSDYEEMCTWLALSCRGKEQHSRECERARQLIRDLEKDIRSALQGEART